MPGSGAQKRSHTQAIRCYNLRQEGFTLSQIADIVCIDKEEVRAMIILGERLISLGEENVKSYRLCL